MIKPIDVEFVVEIWAPASRRNVALQLVLVSCLLVTSFAQQNPHARIESLIRANRVSEAEQQLFERLQSNPNDGWALDRLGSIRLNQKRVPEAKALFERSYSIDSKDPDALKGLAQSAEAADAFDQAIAWYSKIVETRPADMRSRKELAVLQEKVGKYDDSLATIQSIPVAARPPELLPVLASDYLSLHQEQKVGPLVEQVIKLGPGHSSLMLDFVAVLIKNGYVKDSDKILQIARPAKVNAKYLHTLARIREAQGRLDEASALFQRALALEPNSFDLLFDAARFSGQHDRWQDAVNYLQRCDDVAPDRPEVLLKLTLALMKTKRREKAVSVARRMATVAPNDPNANYILAFTLVETELWETAEPIARKALAQNPKDPATHLLMGIIHYNKGELDLARESFNECLRLDPNLADGHYYSALVFDRNGNLDSAEKELDELVAKNPNHAGAQAELGMLKLRTGDAPGARTALEAAVKLEPNSSQTHYQLGLAYARLGMQDESKAQMAQFQKLREAEDNLRKREAGVKIP